MAVVSTRELGRSFSHRFGESPTAQIRIAFLLDGATPTQSIISSGGYVHGTPHPEYAYMLCTDGQVTESSAYQAEAVYSFATPAVGTAGFEASPLARDDVWSFSTSGVAVPTFRYYNGTGNADIKPLVNSAGDPIEGAQAIEGELRLTIAGNRATFPAANAIAVTGALNADSYLGAAPYQWQCLGISGQQTTEVVNGFQVTYWQVAAELSYKQSGYQLYLPNAGFNYLDGGVLKRATVKGPPPDNDDIPSASVVKLTAGGAIQTSGDPIILQRRVNPAVNFATYFGTPPF
jgi:hypothetical protein